VTGAAGQTGADVTPVAAPAPGLERLRAHQWAAVTGFGDPEALDAAILAHRAALGRRRAASGAGLPAWLFARWLRAAAPDAAGPRAGPAACSRGGPARRPLHLHP
jgi:hypothetical protein